MASAKDGTGTAIDPHCIDAFPYVAKGDTKMAPESLIDSYACASSLDESGGEVIYSFTLAAPARVTAWTEGDGGSVDVDVHILTDLAVSGSTATHCAARANVIAEAEMDAGEHDVVVDTYGGDAQAGPFVLHVDAIGDAWTTQTIADGVTWRARRFADACCGRSSTCSRSTRRQKASTCAPCAPTAARPLPRFRAGSRRGRGHQRRLFPRH